MTGKESRLARNRNRRESTYFSNRRLPDYSRLSARPFSVPTFSSWATEVEDRRTWHPEGMFRPARSLTRWSSPIYDPYPAPRRVVSPSRPVRTYTPSSAVGFSRPDGVLICVRRKQRREVLHALRITGRRGSGAYRKPTFNWFSSVHCRRS